MVGGLDLFIVHFIYGIILHIDFHIFSRCLKHQPVYDIPVQTNSSSNCTNQDETLEARGPRNTPVKIWDD